MNTLIKKYSLLILLALLSIQVSWGQPKAVKDSLVAANTIYSAAKYTDCIRKYQYVLSQGYESMEIYYNLGNAFYKTGNATYAILNYERAKKFAPNDEDILYNLDLARTQVVDNIIQLPEPGFVRWWQEFITSRSINFWGICSLITFFTFLSLFGLFLLSGKFQVKRMAFWISIGAISVSAITYAIGESQQSKLIRHNTAVITAPSVKVKASPSDTGTDLFIVHEGITVKLTDELGEWVNVSLPDGNKGWLKESSMVRI